MQAHEINPGTAYKDQNVTVKAFLVNHGDVPQSFGYRIETAERAIVISGDAPRVKASSTRVMAATCCYARPTA